MTTKYSVYDFTLNDYVDYDTRDEALQAFWKNVVSFAKSHFHNNAYMVVEQNEDWSETWYNDNNREIDKPKTAQEIEQLIN